MLILENVVKQFATTTAVDSVSLRVTPGEVVALLGPSGCGKSTLLNLVAGLETPDVGRILWDDIDLRPTPPHLRGFGLMFQDYALFPHMNVATNVGFGLKMAGWDTAQIDSRVSEMLTLVDLPGYGGRDVGTLSGGEQQRVALARSLAPNPRLLMLDEPLGALDRALREQLLGDLRRILRETGQTALYVTHDQAEAFALADRVAVMNAGQIEQLDTPQTIFQRPASVFVARFLGLGNLLAGDIRDGVAHTAAGRFPVNTANTPSATFLLRPNAVTRVAHAEDAHLAGKVLDVVFRGTATQVTVQTGDTNLIVTLDAPVKVGETIQLRVDGAEVLLEV